jgi:DNA repair protein RadC
MELTQKISAADKMLEINVLDRLIITDNGCYSFADEGII